MALMGCGYGGGVHVSVRSIALSMVVWSVYEVQSVECLGLIVSTYI